jgi:hypothetical protein
MTTDDDEMSRAKAVALLLIYTVAYCDQERMA